MSKHEKHVRRERKQTGRARRWACGKWTGAALAAIVAVAVGTAADASPIRFDNPPGAGHFIWAPGVGEPQIALDFTLPPEDQPAPDPFGLTSVRQFLEAAQGGVMTDAPLEMMTGVRSPDSFFLVGVDFGELIPAADTSWRAGACYQWYDGQFPPSGSLLPEDVPVYLGTHFDLGSGYQYGWIGVVMSSVDHGLDAFAWGYETEPGVPIAAGAPEPGTLALLAFGAGIALRRKRRA